MPIKNESINLSSDNIDIKTIQKMLFIYNSLWDGWTVKKLDGEKFEFTKDNLNNENERKEVNLETFIENNLNFTKLFN